MHLLDTDVVWALRAATPGPGAEALAEWASSLLPSTLFVSVVSIMELEGGSRSVERKDKVAAAAIRTWVDSRLRPAFEGRILAVDDAVVRRWSTLSYAEPRDGLLAATALEHGLTLATRNLRAFSAGRVKTCNPWTYAPDAGELDWRRASQGAPHWLKNLFVRA